MRVAIELPPADVDAIQRVARRSGVHVEDLLAEALAPTVAAAHLAESPDLADVAAAAPELLS